MPAPPRGAEPSWAAEVRARAAADPEDAGAVYVLAYLAAARSDRRAALSDLRRLDRLGWDFPLDRREFPGLVDEPEVRALSATFAAREPTVHTSKPSFTIPEPTLIPEGIAFDPESGAFFLGSIAGRKIVRIDLSPSGPQVRDLVSTGLGGVLGIKVDPVRRVLWAAHNPLGRAARRSSKRRSGLAAFDIDTGALVRETGISGAHLFNDVAIAAAGDVYVTDSEGGAVYRLRAAGAQLEPLVAPGTFFYPNGIAWAEDAGRLLVADATGIHRVDPDGTRRRLARGPARTLGAIDGLALSGRTLVGVQNGYGRPRVVRFDLDADLTRVERVEVLETGHEAFDSPTTGVIAGGAFHYIANSHLAAVDDEGNVTNPSALSPPLVLAAPLRTIGSDHTPVPLDAHHHQRRLPLLGVRRSVAANADNRRGEGAGRLSHLAQLEPPLGSGSPGRAAIEYTAVAQGSKDFTIYIQARAVGSRRRSPPGRGSRWLPARPLLRRWLALGQSDV